MFAILTAQAELPAIEGIIKMVCSIICACGCILIALGTIAFIYSIYDLDDSILKEESISRIMAGTMFVTFSTLIRYFVLPKLFPESEIVSEEVTTVVETAENVVEQTSESGISPLTIFVMFLIPVIVIGLYILKCRLEDEIYVEDSNEYKNVDAVNQNGDAKSNESTDFLLKNVHNLNELIRCSTGEIQKKLQHIIDAVKFLDEHDVDTRKLHSYYIPELLSIFNQSREIEETTQFGSILEAKQVHVKELQMNAVQTVTDIVNDLLRNCMDEKIDKLQCDTEVMETVSRQDGYKQDFGFQTYS